MDIYTVRDNLKRTIAGKEKALAEYQEARKLATMAEDIALHSVVEFLKINLNELRAILKDVEVCCEQANEEFWALNPDRSGGQFTQEEIENAGRW